MAAEHPAERPVLSTAQRTVIGVVVGCGGLSLLCLAVGFGFGMLGFRSVRQQSAARDAVAQRDEATSDATRVRLEQVADRLRLAPTVPDELPEAPPTDAWDRPIRYRASSPMRATLTSAGADGDFATGGDNIVVEVLLR